jgi:hypothetical protein
MTNRLPQEAFDYYVSLGNTRSYQQVADHFGVSKRAVAKRASVEEWQSRLKAVEQEVRVNADLNAVDVLETVQTRHLQSLGELQESVREIMTPRRMKAVVAALYKAAVQKEDVNAARLLFDRLLGKPRSEPLSAMALDIPDGLETTADVCRAANALMQAVAEGSLAPEDAQKTAALVEAARKAIETEELEKRISDIERQLKKENR